VQFGWLGQCGRLYSVMVSCLWASMNFHYTQQRHRVQLPCLAMVVGLLGQLITGACFGAQQAHVL
jgi:hypothetical protein